MTDHRDRNLSISGDANWNAFCSFISATLANDILIANLLVRGIAYLLKVSIAQQSHQNTNLQTPRQLCRSDWGSVSAFNITGTGVVGHLESPCHTDSIVCCNRDIFVGIPVNCTLVVCAFCVCTITCPSTRRTRSGAGALSVSVWAVSNDWTKWWFIFYWQGHRRSPINSRLETMDIVVSLVLIANSWARVGIVFCRC